MPANPTAPSATVPPARPPARQLLLEAAARLFYAQGVGATGIDTITTAAGVAKKSLYNNFASKAELVAAYLEARHEEWLDLYRARVAIAATPRERVLAVFDAYLDHANFAYEHGFRGCGLLNAAAELPVGHPGRLAVRQHKEEVEHLLATHLAGLLAGRCPGLRSHQPRPNGLPGSRCTSPSSSRGRWRGPASKATTPTSGKLNALPSGCWQDCDRHPRTRRHCARGARQRAALGRPVRRRGFHPLGHHRDRRHLRARGEPAGHRCCGHGGGRPAAGAVRGPCHPAAAVRHPAAVAARGSWSGRRGRLPAGVLQFHAPVRSGRGNCGFHRIGARCGSTDRTVRRPEAADPALDHRCAPWRGRSGAPLVRRPQSRDRRWHRRRRGLGFHGWNPPGAAGRRHVCPLLVGGAPAHRRRHPVPGGDGQHLRAGRAAADARPGRHRVHRCSTPGPTSRWAPTWRWSRCLPATSCSAGAWRGSGPARPPASRCWKR